MNDACQKVYPFQFNENHTTEKKSEVKWKVK